MKIQKWILETTTSSNRLLNLIFFGSHHKTNLVVAIPPLLATVTRTGLGRQTTILQVMVAHPPTTHKIRTFLWIILETKRTSSNRSNQIRIKCSISISIRTNRAALTQPIRVILTSRIRTGSAVSKTGSRTILVLTSSNRPRNRLSILWETTKYSLDNLTRTWAKTRIKRMTRKVPLNFLRSNLSSMWAPGTRSLTTSLIKWRPATSRTRRLT